MKREIVFFLPEGTINDATEYYCYLLERAFIISGFKVVRANDHTKIGKGQNVLTIRAIDQRKVKRRGGILINWFQGVVPEEFQILYNFSLGSKIFSKVLAYFERKSLANSNLCIFVSNSMLSHFEKKYDLNLVQKSIVVPCYNIPLDIESFRRKERYEGMNFVYAGGLFAWQCIDETLLIFKHIQKINPVSKLTILTGDRENAMKLIQRYKVVNVNVSYVKLENLQEELKKYKYGFLVRKNIVVNNVSTPTKMNSYLAAGLIPIYTNVIDSFEDNINLGKYSLKFDSDEDNIGIAQKVIEFHKKDIDVNEIEAVYRGIFLNYYNDDTYLTELSRVIKKTLI